LKTVYTAMHGVGGNLFMALTKEAGFPEPIKVAKQFKPDSTFPTVAFPTPKNPGQLIYQLKPQLRTVLIWLLPTTPTLIVAR